MVGRGGEPREVDGPRLVEHRVHMEDGKPVTCRLLVSDSIIEAFVNDSVAISYRIYGEAPHELGFYVEDGLVKFDQIGLRAFDTRGRVEVASASRRPMAVEKEGGKG